MHRSTLWLIFAILCIYFSLILCEERMAVRELVSKDSSDFLRSGTTALKEEARTRKRHGHHLYSLWGFYGLAIAYLVKIKVVVVALFVGSAVYLGLRYLWPHHCGGEIYKEGSVVLDHPPSFGHHDHIPYSLEHEHYSGHNFDGSSYSGPTSYEPYSAYASNSYPESEATFPSGSYSETGGPSDVPTFRRKRSTPETANKKATGFIENLARQMVISEEQIGDFMFNFLGLDTNACRRRFICEMEFKAKTNPLTSLAFRVIGRSFFDRYTNEQNPLRKAIHFGECAAVNSECVFIENNEETEEKTTNTAEQGIANEPSEHQSETATEDNSLESNDIVEKENEKNLRAEVRRNSYRRRLRGSRY